MGWPGKDDIQFSVYLFQSITLSAFTHLSNNVVETFLTCQLSNSCRLPIMTTRSDNSFSSQLGW